MKGEDKVDVLPLSPCMTCCYLQQSQPQPQSQRLAGSFFEEFLAI